MTKHLLEGYRSQKGVHCSSTSLTEIVDYYGLQLNESLVFGISSGLDFIYAKYPYFDFSRILSGRTPVLESNFFKLVDNSNLWRGGEIIEWDTIRSYIDKGIPLLFLTDIYHLPFYNTKRSNFTGHTLTVVGYNRNDKIIYVSDYISDQLFELKFSDLINSIEKAKPLFNA
ncbi:BtrH N-terminal domain-containing protein [Oceanobacillus bengalensis]|uniref:Butirosin biosynthesis protein H N-terminal domain-containing protein n=1 Tax=Oceanobacillus bengalensis TaxID=1435466 RepID=A0A494Z3F1_9BACI|nr:BtrH N-terminal domain-containing protein [Oceanobacillus bengalensis]RKQ16539.1 hypothetical protein D8M05_06575 [Oceanobacillus bengalensis]